MLYLARVVELPESQFTVTAIWNRNSIHAPRPRHSAKSADMQHGNKQRGKNSEIKPLIRSSPYTTTVTHSHGAPQLPAAPPPGRLLGWRMAVVVPRRRMGGLPHRRGRLPRARLHSAARGPHPNRPLCRPRRRHGAAVRCL